MKLRHKLYYVFGKNFAFLNEEKHLLRVYKKKINLQVPNIEK